MSDFWSGFVTGLLTSSIVAVVVYLVQRKDSLKSESNLANRIVGTTAVAREGLRTTIELKEITEEIHKAVRGHQITAAGTPGETLRDDHLKAADKFLDDIGLSALSVLHTRITGNSVAFAGVIRDAKVSIAGDTDPALMPVGSLEVDPRLKVWLEQFETVINTATRSEPEIWKEISRLHVELMRIHPFFDGNGLLGRAIVFAMCKRLLRVSCKIPRDDPNYFSSLRQGLAGNEEAFCSYLRSLCEA